MTTAKKITKYLEEYLQVQDFKDYCHNGCQVEGSEEVQKVITGVSLSQKLIKEAINKKAEMIIVHHGFFMDAFGSPAIVKGVMRARLKMLLEHNINLLGFHLPLDAHIEIGNNASICKKLEIKNLEKFGVGFIGDLKIEISFEQFLDQVNKLFHVKAYSIHEGKSNVKKIAVSSGGSARRVQLAVETEADVLLTGDILEQTVRETEELNMNFINAGHYNTEKFGVQNLGELIADKFGLDVEFIDIPNEI